MGNGAGTRSTLARMSARRYGAVTVTYSATGQGILQNLVGHALADQQIAALAGAVPGTTVLVRGGLLLVSGPGVSADVFVSHDDQGHLALGQIRAEYASPRARAEALSAQVRAARTLGVEHIGAKVHGGIADQNWALMPQLGYDASVERVAHELHVGRDLNQPRATIPAHLASARTYYDLWRGDPQWLQSVVMNPDLTFDTRAGSRSSKRLAAYLRTHRTP
jgi:hypothetical protein